MILIKKAFIFIFYFLLRIILFPFSIIIRKRKGNVCFVGYNNAYIGNSKHLFEYYNNEINSDAFFITNNKYVYNNNQDKNVKYLYNIKTIFAILRTEVIVVDSTPNRLIGILSFRKKVVQLWHGNGMKEIALMTMSKNKIIFNLRKAVTYFIGSLIKYDLIYFTGEFAYNARKTAFSYKGVSYNGQPRNDVIFNARTDNNRNILYVPTWREGNVSTLAYVDLNKIDDYCYKNDVIFNLKLHPQEKFSTKNNFKAIKILDKNVDIYDELKNTDIMITDYSSIYFDFLLLDRPLIFFAFDKEDYLSHRNIVYDYDEITPGLKVFNTEELIEEINNLIIFHKDLYKEDRKNVRNLFYEYQDDMSCSRATKDIIELLNKKY